MIIPKWGEQCAACNKRGENHIYETLFDGTELSYEKVRGNWNAIVCEEIRGPYSSLEDARKVGIQELAKVGKKAEDRALAMMILIGYEEEEHVQVDKA